MRKSLIILMAIMFCVAGAFSASAQNGYNLELEPANATGDAQTAFNQGDTVNLNINLANSPGVAGCAFTLLYDATKLTAPVTNADGTSADITSVFPFTTTVSGDTTPTQTHRANSTESGKIYFSGAEITAEGGSKIHPTNVTLFTVKFTIPATAPSGTAVFTLQQTTLTNTAAGWNGEAVPVIVGAVSNTDSKFGGDLSDDFPVMLGDAAHPFTAITAPIQIGDATYPDWIKGYGVDYPTAEFSGEQEDLDHDGYSNIQEMTNGTNPTVADAAGGTEYNNVSDFRVSNLDIDGNGKAELLTDAVLLYRYLADPYGFIYTDAEFVAGALATNATRTTTAQIKAYIAQINEAVYDVDESGKPTLLSDGVMIYRHIADPFRFIYTDAEFLAGAEDPYCVRCGVKEIRDYIDLLFPHN